MNNRERKFVYKLAGYDKGIYMLELEEKIDRLEKRNKKLKQEVKRLNNCINKIQDIINEYDFSIKEEWYNDPENWELDENCYAPSYIDLHKICLILKELKEEDKE